MKKIIKHFKFEKKSTSLHREILAGLTTFSSMAYIIIVNPQILHEMDLNLGALMVATIIVTAFACIFMGFFANLPIAIAPGMGVSAFAVYSIAIKNKVPPETILTACFFAGILLFILNVLKIRQKILNSIPKPIFTSLIVGIGLFLMMVALKQIGVIIPQEGSYIRLGTVHQLEFYLTAVGFLLILYLLRKGVKAAFLYVILLSWFVSIFSGITSFHGIVSLPPSVAPTWFKLDFSNLASSSFFTAFFSIFLVTLFDSSAGILMLGKMLYPTGKIPKMQRALTPDSIGSTVGSLFGSTSLAIHLESAAGIKAGGRTGLTAIIVGILFICCLFFYPVVESIPKFASAPVLLTIGFMMVEEIKHLNWKDYSDVLPALITIGVMPITFSIYLGFAVGFISYCFLKIITGNFSQISIYTWVLSAIFLFHLLFLY